MLRIGEAVHLATLIGLFFNQFRNRTGLLDPRQLHDDIAIRGNTFGDFNASCRGQGTGILENRRYPGLADLERIAKSFCGDMALCAFVVLKRHWSRRWLRGFHYTGRRCSGIAVFASTRDRYLRGELMQLVWFVVLIGERPSDINRQTDRIHRHAFRSIFLVLVLFGSLRMFGPTYMGQSQSRIRCSIRRISLRHVPNGCSLPKLTLFGRGISSHHALEVGITIVDFGIGAISTLANRQQSADRFHRILALCRPVRFAV